MNEEKLAYVVVKVNPVFEGIRVKQKKKSRLISMSCLFLVKKTAGKW